MSQSPLIKLCDDQRINSDLLSLHDFRDYLIWKGILNDESDIIHITTAENDINHAYYDQLIPESIILTESEQLNNLIDLRRVDLPASEMEQVNRILNNTSFTHNVLTDKFDIDMTEIKISCLKPCTWLNDEVINFYMCLLQQRDNFNIEISDGRRVSSHYFNTFFINKLINKGEYNYANAKRWTKKFNVFSKDKIFIPVNISNTHWTIIVVFIKLKEIHYYDSMGGSGINRYLKHILHWLKDESKEKYNNEYIINNNEWKLIDQEDDVPQQRNGFDCGMFTILCADFLSDNIPLNNSYDQNEISSYRKKVCASILRGELNF